VRNPPSGTEAQIQGDLIRWTRRVAIFTGVLATFTGLLFLANVAANFFIYRQWRVASDAQENTRSVLRAVVTVNAVTLTVSNDKDGHPAYYSFAPTFHNFGSTRTDRFNAWYNIKYFPVNVPDNMDFTKPATPIETRDIIIGPNSSPLLQPVTVTKDEIDHALKKDGVIVIWGHADYSDVFDPKVTRPIGFCLLLNPTTNTTTGEIVVQPTTYRNDCNTNR
jgi:hypothetical protein